MTAPVTLDMKVEEILSRYPQTLDLFVAYGFRPLKNPLMRKTFAPVISIRAAAKMHRWDPARIDQFLHELNDLAQSPAPAPASAPEIDELPLFDLKDVDRLEAQNIRVSPEVVRVDNRGLEPPEPMLRILAIVQQLASGQRLEAINYREPVLLYPRLDEIGFQHVAEPLPDGSYLITITRAG